MRQILEQETRVKLVKCLMLIHQAQYNMLVNFKGAIGEIHLDRLVLCPCSLGSQITSVISNCHNSCHTSLWIKYLTLKFCSLKV